jgi:hypothetical protein
MRSGGVRRAFCAPMRLSRLSGVVAAFMFGALAAGCSSQQTARFASLNAVPSNATIAFESIDGPPPEVFRKLVAALTDEAGARKVTVVSRTGPATYRVRGYVSAMVDRGKPSFAWVWDVYDNDKRRTLRIAGEEPGAAAARRRDAWAAADDQVLRRMSRTGMERLAAFLNSPGQPPAATPEPTLPVLVAGRDDSPEAAGIFRILGGPRAADGAAPRAGGRGAETRRQTGPGQTCSRQAPFRRRRAHHPRSIARRTGVSGQPFPPLAEKLSGQ